MSSLNFYAGSLMCGLLLISTTNLAAFTSAPATSTKPSSSKPLESPPPRKDNIPQTQPFKHLQKPELPAMLKPFGMPGVIGLQDGKWEGTDYLGYLSNNIGVEVEISKAENVQISLMKELWPDGLPTFSPKKTLFRVQKLWKARHCHFFIY